MKLSNQEKQLVLDNRGLVYHEVRKLNVAQNQLDYEDIISIGTIGLIKAATTFDSSKNILFATYGSKCIKNEIFMYCRKSRKYTNDISLEKVIRRDEEGNSIFLGDTIEHYENDFTQRVINREMFVQLFSIVLNCLNDKRRIATIYRIGEETQAEIAKKLNVSQSYVSRCIITAFRKIRKIMNNQVHYKKVFLVESVDDDRYRISFLCKDVNKCYKVFEEILKEEGVIEYLSGFKFFSKKERITIQVPDHPKSFCFIAQFIQRIDDLKRK